jgi:hypothetical protein
MNDRYFQQEVSSKILGTLVEVICLAAALEKCKRKPGSEE